MPGPGLMIVASSLGSRAFDALFADEHQHIRLDIRQDLLRRITDRNAGKAASADITYDNKIRTDLVRESRNDILGFTLANMCLRSINFELFCHIRRVYKLVRIRICGHGVKLHRVTGTTNSPAKIDNRIVQSRMIFITGIEINSHQDFLQVRRGIVLDQQQCTL